MGGTGGVGAGCGTSGAGVSTGAGGPGGGALSASGSRCTAAGSAGGGAGAAGGSGCLTESVCAALPGVQPTQRPPTQTGRATTHGTQERNAGSMIIRTF